MFRRTKIWERPKQTQLTHKLTHRYGTRAHRGRRRREPLTPQTTAQILRCLMLGSYETCVVAGEPKIRSSLPLVGPLPDSTRAQRDEISDHSPPQKSPRKSMT